MKRYFNFLFFSTLLGYCTPSFAVQIVSIQTEYGGTTQTLDLELFDDIAGPSVANFLNYVNDDGTNGFRFNNTFIARSIPDFILQTGSYTFRPDDPATERVKAVTDPTSALAIVPTDPPILNEFNLSNIRGTIAFARTSVVDSATSGWFINLSDNSENLDNQNGGFTVFGSVIDDGMVIADEMATFPIQTFAGGALGPDFVNLPVVNYDFEALIPPGIFQSNLIMLTNFTVITRPIARLTPSSGDFQLDISGDGIEQVLTTTLKNTGNEALNIGAIGNLTAPFSIKSNNCLNATLLPQSVDTNSTCTIDIAFSSTTLNIFEDKLVIPYTNILNTANYSVSYPILGEGAPANALSSVSPTDILFDDTPINSTSEEIITIRNKGGSTLNIGAINLTGADKDQYTVDNSDCIVAANTLNINETCDLTVSFAPSTVGIKNATLEILTSANTSTVTLKGTVTNPVLSVQPSLNLVSSINETIFESFTATNAGTGELIISSVIISGSDAAFFASGTDCIDANNQGIPIESGHTCVIGVVFTPTDNIDRTATLTLTSNDMETPTFSMNLTGTTSTTSDPVISTSSAFDVGASQVNGDPSTKELIITNTGIAPLEITSISGLSNTDFSQTNNCIGTGIQIAQNDTCTVLISLNSTLPGTSTATLTIASNDPVNQTINISISGFGDTDSDGIIGSIELASPNAGDGNNDGITDDLQSNVATLIATNSNYITFISENSLILDSETAFVDIVLIDSIPDNKPDNAKFDYGLYSYSITLPVGDGVNVGILLPANENPTSFYKYGSTTDDASLHWYDFSYEETTGTGAKFIGKVTIQSPTGTDASIQRNLVLVSYIDGQRGDDDLQINGSILNTTSGISISNTSDSGSGSLSYLQILILLIIKIWQRKAFRKTIRIQMLS